MTDTKPTAPEAKKAEPVVETPDIHETAQANGYYGDVPPQESP